MSKFSDKVTSNGLDITEWCDDIMSYFDSRNLNESQKCEFIMDHLEGQAKSEFSKFCKECLGTMMQFLSLKNSSIGKITKMGQV